MSEKNKTCKIRDKRQLLLVALCWAVYTASYLGKYCFNANIESIGRRFSVNNASVGLVGTCFFFAYGAGQVINGVFCKKYDMRLVVFASLIASAACNAFMAFSENFSAFKYVWFINGAALSVLWPTLIRLLSESIDDEYSPRAVIVMGTTVAVGTFLAYGISALFNAVVKDGTCYKYSFLVAVAVMPVLAAVWLVSYNKLARAAKDDGQEVAAYKPPEPERKGLGAAMTVTISVLAVFAIITNLVKDGFTTWIPKILSDVYNTPDYLSILLTLALPIFALFGTALAVAMNKGIKDLITICWILFAGITSLIGVVLSTIEVSAAIMLVSLSVVSLMTSAINNVITSMFPLYYKDEVNSGMCAGVLNGFCYIGSTISSYGLGALSDAYGWNAVFILLCSASAFCFVTGVIKNLVDRIKNKR